MNLLYSINECDNLVLQSSTRDITEIVSITTYRNCCEKQTTDITVPKIEIARCDALETSVKVELLVSNFPAAIDTVTHSCTGGSTTATGSTISRVLVEIPDTESTVATITVTDEDGNVYVFAVSLDNDGNTCDQYDSPYVLSYTLTSTLNLPYCGITFDATQINLFPCAFEENCDTCTLNTLANGIYTVKVTYDNDDVESFCILVECDALFCQAVKAYTDTGNKEILNAYYALVGVSNKLNSSEAQVANCNLYFTCDDLCYLYLVLMNYITSNSVAETQSTTNTITTCSTC